MSDSPETPSIDGNEAVGRAAECLTQHHPILADPGARRGVDAGFIRQAVAKTACGLKLDECAVHSPALAHIAEGPADRDSRLPIVIADARRGIAGVAPLPGLSIAAVKADGVAVVAPDLPSCADLDGAAPAVIDEGVLAVLPVRLQLKRQPIRHAVFGEHAQGRVTPPPGQITLLASSVEAGVGAQPLVFDDGLALALRLGPRAGENLGRRQRREDQPPRDNGT